MGETGARREIEFESALAGLPMRIAERILAGRAGAQKSTDGGAKDVRRRNRGGGDKVISFSL